MPPLLEPLPLSRLMVEQSGGRAPQMASGMVEIEDRHRAVGKALVVNPLETTPPITQPDDLRGRFHRLSLGFEGEHWDELLEIAQHGHHSPL